MRSSFMLESVLSDLRLAIRLLSKQPLFTLITILTLAIGIGANSAIFSVVENVLVRPLPYPHPERLVMMAQNEAEISNRMISYPNFVDWRERNDVFDSLSTVRDFDMTVTDGSSLGVITIQIVAADYFKVLGLNPLIGRGFSIEDERSHSNVAIISKGFWREHFGADEQILGRQINLNRTLFTIIGVMPDVPYAQPAAPLWLLIGGDWAYFRWARDHREERTAGYVVGRLKPGVEIGRAREKMNDISAELLRNYPRENAGGSGVSVVYLQDSLTDNVRPALLLLWGSVSLVLLIACANVASLLLARALSRRREAAICAALGASRVRIMRQAITESLVLAVPGGGVGLLFAFCLMSLYGSLNYRIGPGVGYMGLDGYAVAFTFALALLAGLGFGVVSAWYGSSVNLHLLGREGSRTFIIRSNTKGIGVALRNLIVIVEIAMALALLVSAGLMIKSFVRLARSPLGFDPHQVTALELNLPFGRYDKRSDRNGFFRQLLVRVAALPGVESVSIASSKPGFPDKLQNDIYPEDHPRLRPGEIINVDWDPVTEDYFATMKIGILRGRSFAQEEVDEGRPVVVVDESLAKRFWPGQDALGKWIKYDSAEKHQIVGIASDVKRFRSKLQPLIKIYTPFGRAKVLQSVLLIRTPLTDRRGLIAAVTATAQGLDSDIPVNRLEAMDGLLAEVAMPVKLCTALLACFSIIATVLAASGLYGLISYLVTERTREIGVRMAIGASRRQIVTLIMAQGLRLTALGMFIGLGMSVVMTRVMTSLLYGVSARDPVTLLATALLLGLVAALGCLIPTLRATRIDPARALQCD